MSTVQPILFITQVLPICSLQSQTHCVSGALSFGSPCSPTRKASIKKSHESHCIPAIEDRCLACTLWITLLGFTCSHALIFTSKTLTWHKEHLNLPKQVNYGLFIMAHYGLIAVCNCWVRMPLTWLWKMSNLSHVISYTYAGSGLTPQTNINLMFHRCRFCKNKKNFIFVKYNSNILLLL